jgi:glycine cleavage system aminomethyltransferase T
VLAAQERGPRDALVGFEAGGPDVPAEGAAVVRDGRIIGRVTSSKWSATLGRPIGLAWLRADEAADGTPITVRLGVGRARTTTSAVVRTQPFYDPAGERLRS